ncbi:MAG: anti-sigma regulatory factor [Acidobacteriaceae bacterium]
MLQPHRSIAITDRSSVGEARRVSIAMAQRLGFDEARRSDIGIVVTEAATNILVHAATGELLICPFSSGNSAWLDIVALDSGPGIGNVDRAMEDGFSSTGTAGQGLGAIERLSDRASLYSQREKGTVYWSRFICGEAEPASSAGVVNIPVHGEDACGDSFVIQTGSSRSLYMVVDGLGHGTGASEAAAEAVETFNRYSDERLTEIISRCHNALKKTRGAAMSIAAVDHERQTLTYSGVGNVSATLITGTTVRNLLSQNGTLGAVLPRVPQEYTYPVEQNTSLLMYSDGLSSRVNLSGYPGIQSRHAGLIAGVLYRDFGRKRDDATALFAPIGGASA